MPNCVTYVPGILCNLCVGKLNQLVIKPALCRFFCVRPARAHSWRCKSSRKLATANEVKRNCGRVTDRGEEAWSVNREPMDKNRIRGGAEQGERA